LKNEEKRDYKSKNVLDIFLKYGIINISYVLFSEENFRFHLTGDIHEKII